MQISKAINSQESAASMLRQRRDALLARLPVLDAPAFMEQHTRILDEFFRERFETSLIGPQLGICQESLCFYSVGRIRPR